VERSADAGGRRRRHRRLPRVVAGALNATSEPGDGTGASSSRSTPADPSGGPARAVKPLRVAIVAANTFEFDSRLTRTAHALADDGHRVTLVAFAAPGLPEHERLAERLDVRRVAVDRTVVSAVRPLPIPIRRALGRLLGIPAGAVSLPPSAPRGGDRLRAPVRRLVEIVAHVRRAGPWRSAVLRAVPDADVYHCKALIALPVIRGAARSHGARYVYDLADLHTEAARLARMPSFVRRLVREREGRWVREAAGLTAVSEGVAAEAAKRFHVERPVVALNCPPAWRPQERGAPASTRITDATGIAPGRPVILYQGGFSVDRGIEELAAAIDRPELRAIDAAAVFLGYGRLRDWLRAEAERRPDRIYVLDAVPPSDLLEWTASADLGFVGQPPRTLNQRLNLANKLFESIMAGVPVLVADGTEHCRVVASRSLGACCDVSDPGSIARAAAALLSAPADERAVLREHCRQVALDEFTWERQRDGLVALYRRLAALRQQG